MLTSIDIKNFKSTKSLNLSLGRVNVFIGENGSGKSTILEALTFAGAASAGQLNDTFLEVRGVRTTSPKLMRSRFTTESSEEPIHLTLFKEGRTSGSYLSCEYILKNDNNAYSQWELSKETRAETAEGKVINNIDRAFSLPILLGEYVKSGGTIEEIMSSLQDDSSINDIEELINLIKKFDNPEGKELIQSLAKNGDKFKKTVTELFAEMNEFTIYSPQNEQLRDLVKESKLKPLGTYGEGLFKLLMVIYHEEPESFYDIEKGLKLFGWFKSIQLPKKHELESELLLIEDKYLESKFHLNSVNEGFLYVLFYMALIISKDTPKIFAIDNIDAALNPKLCAKIMSYISELCKKYGKQIFLTTQNPAILDGIDLYDNDQRLFVVSRNKKGHTQAKRFTTKSLPKDEDGENVMLSEAMIRGYIGGLPRGF